MDGKGSWRNANVEITCGSAAAVTGTTAADGAYRINVAQQGQCTLVLPGPCRQALGDGLLESESRALQLRAGEGRRRELRAEAALSMSESDAPPAVTPPPDRRHRATARNVAVDRAGQGTGAAAGHARPRLLVQRVAQRAAADRQQHPALRRDDGPARGSRQQPAQGHVQLDPDDVHGEGSELEDQRGRADPPADPEPRAAGLQLPRIARHRSAVQGCRAPHPRRARKGPIRSCSAASSRWRCR